MAYDKAVIFCYQNKLKDDQTTNYRIDSCEWGWLVNDDEAEAAESLELPGADLSGEELAVRVVPKQVDEFACSRCFLVHHITQLAKGEGAKAVCKECS